MNNRYYQTTKPLNQQLHDLMQRMHACAPEIARLSFAKYDKETDRLTTYADSEFDLWNDLHHEHRFNKLNHLKRSASTGVARIVNDLRQISHCERVQFLLQKGYRSSAAVPCYQNRRFSGFVFLNSYQTNAFNSRQLGALAPYFEMVQFTVESQYQVVDTIATFAERLISGQKLFGIDSYYHGRRMKLYTRLIAEYVADDYGLDDEQVEAIALFSQFHDIGKSEVSEKMLYTDQRLSETELDSVREHIDNGIRIMNEIVDSVGSPSHPSVMMLNQIMHNQYEFMDGSGYPNGVSRDLLPIPAHIITVANIFDAMTTHKSYRQAWSIRHALLEMEKMVHQGKLDSECVDALRSCQQYLKKIIIKFPEPSLHH
ncbi:HD-GYP domain-containing protein [Vibrio sp. LaRot3]|uniref:HD-GYP domain-containing protein n=1 Tax=Vibrio sp. LaRot3 TaxID=2998829 RepID=UPI0022CE025A|nr:HD domain-containing phosphohydrolase [Vibrio sp. LaRot3]MDA0149637.1 hypothetical protein [Vibrio sp. LaRot3]